MITTYLRINTPVNFGNVFPGEVVTKAGAFSVHFSDSVINTFCLQLTPVATPGASPTPSPCVPSQQLLVEYKVYSFGDLASYLSMALAAGENAGTDPIETSGKACLNSTTDTIDVWDVKLNLSSVSSTLGDKTGTITIEVTAVGSCSLL